MRGFRLMNEGIFLLRVQTCFVVLAPKGNNSMHDFLSSQERQRETKSELPML